MAELLLELFSEEIPARMQSKAAADLARLVGEGLKAAGLDFDRLEGFATARRLAVVVDGLPAAQLDTFEERRGPRVGAPDKAIEGFLKGAGITRDKLEERETDKGSFYYAVIETKGRPTLAVLPELLNAAISALSWPKPMKWGAYSARWVRPLHNILCLFNGETVPLKWEHLTANNQTFGHRFMAPAAFAVKDFADYRARLKSAYVVLDSKEREQIIAKDAARLASVEGLSVIDDPALLSEVAGLVEWPESLIGSIDTSFLSVPEEALISAMRSHQKYFSLAGPDGKMAPRFIVVANLRAEDGGKAITAGNERVLSARLSDARFFWDQDRKRTLESRVQDLEKIIFHARLGTVREKVARLMALTAEIAPYVPGADAALAARAALLAKADLTTEMVGEFADLQGLMGRYYAEHDGENPEVAKAIQEHYSPLGPGDNCPTDPVSVVVALADKIDTLTGFFAIDEKPTGSKDPYALRRAALGVIRLVLENKMRMPLLTLFEKSGELHKGAGMLDAAELLAFFADRLKVHLKEQNVRHDYISAAFALEGEDDLVRLMMRIEALSNFLGTDDGANLLTAYRRAANILRIEEKKDGHSYDAPADKSLLEDPAEIALNDKIEEISGLINGAITFEKFAEAGSAMATLRKPVDAFFEQVTVNADDPTLRANRLRLLSSIRNLLDQLADFSKIEG
ncbi:MAG: glycine--tRNA ligase subunit beta [Sneathiella sp.]|jgi:glycyl-tRNA synthetase beta chain|uniref:glycine--tRNA ligase subunit beta n=1 Tax=Sneathiella sp. TaxID=1964365 RepID=UPI000C3ED360|nr:glycine--tRNA ligase subunit beta [Sneathiella sp.]MAL78141.1 glycine--tRNA ligase subunit beta [Sneathiella sp.]